MDIKIIKEIELQKKIPIIGKLPKSEIANTFLRLINANFRIIEITLRSKYSLDVAVMMKKNFQVPSLV